MSRISSIAQSIDLVPSSYTGLTSLTTTTQYPASNGYTNSSSTTYARFTISSGSTGYLYYTFDCSSIPSDATITSITGTVKAYVSSTSRVTSTQCQLFTGTTAKGSNVTFASTSSSNTVNITTGSSWTRSELDDLRLKIGGTGSSGNGSRYIYFYGADITINYTIPGTEYEISFTNNTSSVTTNPSQTEYILEGEDEEITFTNVSDISTLSVTDNNINVTSELVYVSSGTYKYTLSSVNEDHIIELSTVTAYNVYITNNSTLLSNLTPSSTSRTGEGSNLSISFLCDNVNNINVYDNDVKNNIFDEVIQYNSYSDTLIPSSYTDNSNFTLSNPQNGYTDSSSSSYVYMTIAGSATASIYFEFDTLSIPSEANITSIAASATFQFAANNSTSGFTSSCQLYSGTTSIGSSTTIASSGSNVSKTTFVLDTGSGLTAEEINNGLRLYVTATNSANRTSRYLYFYGADIIVNYEVAGQKYYKYVVQNIQSDRTIRFEDKPKHTVYTSSTFSGITLSPSNPYIYEESYVNFVVDGASNNYSVKLTLDSVDVTNDYINNDFVLFVEDNGNDRNLVVSEQDTFTVSYSSSYSGATINSSSASVYKNDSFIVTLYVSDISLVSVSDNDKMITGRFSSSGTGIYTCTIENVNENHTILVVEHITYEISITNDTDSFDVSPSGTQTVDAGDSLYIAIDNDNIRGLVVYKDNIKDNENLEQRLVYSTSLIPASFNSSSTATVTNSNNGLTNTSSSTYSTMTISSNLYMEYLFDTSNFFIPSNATSITVTCSVKGCETRSNSSANAQLYSGTTAKGSSTQLSYSNNNSPSIISLATGTWSANEISDIRLRITGTYSSNYSNYYAYFYGAELTISFTMSNSVYYVYKIEDISDNYTIIFKEYSVYDKTVGEYLKISHIYKKIFGSWVEVNDYSELFESNKIYIRN